MELWKIKLFTYLQCEESLSKNFILCYYFKLIIRKIWLIVEFKNVEI